MSNDQPSSDENPDSEQPQDDLNSPLRSVHTSNFPQLLRELKCTLFVSTYQAGRLVLLRPEPEKLNTHFRGFNKPMGVALAPDRLALGTSTEIWEFHNIPATASRIDPDHPPDYAYLPRSAFVTGDVQIHEMEWGWNSLDPTNSPTQETTLWFINTRFSCLCTRSPQHSFYPRWRPPFISAYAPEDRCHLNGLGMVNGYPKFASALGESDKPAGWRDNKASGGIVMEIPSGEIIARGLSMPHSPRWYADRLWILNSGDGGFGWIDLPSGKYQEVIQLPGFTRGLSFAGQFAFIGLSQVRESAIFSGIKIAERPEEERWSGVAVVDLTSGNCVAWLRFEDQVQEVFAVSALHNSTWPDLINDNKELIELSYVLPDEALKDVPDEMRSK